MIRCKKNLFTWGLRWIGVEHDDGIGQRECSVDVVEGSWLALYHCSRSAGNDLMLISAAFARQTERSEEHAKRHVPTRILEREWFDECFQHLKSTISIQNQFDRSCIVWFLYYSLSVDFRDWQWGRRLSSSIIGKVNFSIHLKGKKFSRQHFSCCKCNGDFLLNELHLPEPCNDAHCVRTVIELRRWAIPGNCMFMKNESLKLIIFTI